MIVDTCPSQNSGHAPTVAFEPFILLDSLCHLPVQSDVQSRGQGWGPRKKGRIRKQIPHDDTSQIPNHGLYRGGIGPV